MSHPPSIVILTGAGISAESGVSTFRDQNGLWEGYPIEDVATPEGFQANPGLVHEFYNKRRQQLNEVQPNAAHLALAQLEKEWSGDFLLVTQNVDDLHERAGSRKLLHMHGELKSIYCQFCQFRQIWTADLGENNACPDCRKLKSLRPDIVWFGETPYHMDEISAALEKCDYFVSIGTSGVVYPAAGFVQRAARAHKIEVNLKNSAVASLFDQQYTGPATKEVPKLVHRFRKIF